MKLLALDTSTEACSAALYIDGEIEQRFEMAPREHTQLILPMIDDLLSAADIKIKQLDALAFGRGPGSFTGVRIATGIVQGMAFGADLPVIPVSTLASIAQSVYDDHHHTSVLAAIDARMGEVYWGQFRINQQGIMVLVGEEMVIKPDQVSSLLEDEWAGAGSAWAVYENLLNRSLVQPVNHYYADYYPQSGSIAKLAVYDFEQGVRLSADQAIPLYLRNDVAKKSTKTK
ncbi:MAG: tRNA (adenosine(37)-N6)-threonylcarbamoyltransferase complex dimerization subunit type 1 TsaB [Gammaproteobacteria bacterium]|nr:tRNA (adenosine(37)-N6)-threonylcarbamoyltransferase complex dimerization subunit type 1 TsaB [Gammaproteobacteria bacterium]MDH5735957.1 tRNA (adenosine(37)-N6)-threonylcarbamoyltransferase complex dimerization subunit type 1 TsaB [Gammaproteobacteria bacterium]